MENEICQNSLLDTHHVGNVPVFIYNRCLLYLFSYNSMRPLNKKYKHLKNASVFYLKMFFFIYLYLYIIIIYLFKCMKKAYSLISIKNKIILFISNNNYNLINYTYNTQVK